MNGKGLIFILLLILMGAVHAAPRQIILLRHADKLPQKLTGPAVSAKGYVRAIKFAFYILDQYGEPDFVVAGKPKGKDASIRELQTVGPLVNILAERHPEQEFPILHPYTHDEYKKLAKYLLKDDKFDDKLILICWRHTNIAPMAKALGVKDDLYLWPADDFDSVYILDFTKSGKIKNARLLHRQYSVDSPVNWESIRLGLSGII